MPENIVKSLQSAAPSRRAVLLGSGAAAAATVLRATPVVTRKVRYLLAEGVAELDSVIAEQPLIDILDAGTVAAVQGGFVEIRVRWTYPVRRNVAVFTGFVALPGSPMPIDTPASVFTVLELEVYDTLVSATPENTFGLFGRFLREPVPSPYFPNLEGRIAAVTAGFENEGETSFKLVGGIAAGSHATYARHAKGVIEL